jgi:hypothetical protein
MKKSLILLSIALLLFACQKESSFEPIQTENNEFSEFKKEIVVKDKSGENSIFLAVYGKSQEILDYYLANNSFDLLINEDDINFMESQSQTLENNSEEAEFNPDNYKLDKEPKIQIDLIATNLQENVSSYSLETITSKNKGYFQSSVSYTTKRSFLGAIHKGGGYDFYASTGYQKRWYNRWTSVDENIRIDTYLIYWIYVKTAFDVHKRLIIIYPHSAQRSANYKIVYRKEDFRGHTCPIGSYDNNNGCYIGHPPAGGRAFFYTSVYGDVWQYYSAVNGKCTYPGSVYDKGNCMVKKMPKTSLTGNYYIWDNNWYTEPNRIIL